MQAPALKPELDLDRRRPVWEALSDLYLDTELDESGLEFIARRIGPAGYSPAELEYILRREVGRAVGDNLNLLMSVAGEWAGFDPEWIEQEILKNERGWRRWFPRYTAWGMIRADWKRVLEILNERS